MPRDETPKLFHIPVPSTAAFADIFPPTSIPKRLLFFYSFPDLAPDHNNTVNKMEFNSVTMKGRANVAKATLGGFAAVGLYFYMKGGKAQVRPL